MKNLRYIFSLLSLIAFAACDNGDEQIIDPEAPLPKVSFNISAEVPDSRTALLQDDNGNYRAYWKDGDPIFALEIADSTPSIASGNISGDALSTSFTVTFSGKSASEYIYMFACPNININSTATYLYLKLPTEQSPAAMTTFDGAADILLSNAVVRTTQPSGETIPFEVSRLSSIGKVTVKNLALAEGDKVKSVTFSASKPLTGELTNIMVADIVAEKDPLTNSAFAVAHNSVKVTLPEAQSGDFTYFMSCWPTTLSAGEQYTVTVQTEQDTFTKTATLPSNLAFLQGEMTSFTVNMAGIAPGGSGSGDSNAIPNNEIHYTSTDGKVVTPYKTDVFGANIVSNTYSNGHGVITFDADVTSIGMDAFLSCGSLASITIPDSVTSIGDYAFQYCSSLTNVTIPDSVTSIGWYAFSSCSSLQAFYGKYASSDNRCLVIDGVLKSFAPSGLTSYTIPNSVTSIGIDAFYGCSSLTNVTIPDSVTSIGNGAFRSCSNLQAFYGKYASSDNRCLVIDGVLNSFAPSGLTSYTIPDSITSIGEWAFYNCSSLTSVTIPESVTSIESSAFSSCSSLTSVTIGNSVTSIGKNAFRSCSSLKSVIIGNSVTLIGNYAFYKCSGLTSVTIPESVTSIGNYAFYGCSSLTSVYCKPTTPPTLSAISAFASNASSRKIYVPAASLNAYKSAENWSTYADDIVADSNSEPAVDLSQYTDLSAEGTANCYLIQATGNYKLKAVKGNSTVSVGDAQSASVLWETFGTATTPNIGDLVTNAGYQDGYVYFSTPSTFANGNASIAVRDSSGTILWSWHIWCSAEGWEDDIYANNAGTMMDRNLGATSATPGSVGALGLMYQWGRKDPFLGSSSISASSLAKSTGKWTTNSSQQTVEGTCQNPTIFIYTSDAQDWCIGDGYGDSNYDLRWKDTGKTAYDPCPVGYRVSKGGENGFWATALGTSSPTSSGTTWNSSNKGRNWTLADGTTAWYPAAGYRTYDSGALYYVGSYGHCWSASPDPGDSSDAYNWDFDAGYVSPAHDSFRGYGFSVRCFREGSDSGTAEPVNSQILYTTTDGNIVKLNNSGAFWANIVSNTYENGQGVITFDGQVTTIGDNAFRNCETLKTIEIPEGVEEIGYQAFEVCSSLESITIPTTLKSFGSVAFNACEQLKSVHISDLTAWCKITPTSGDCNPLSYGADLYLNGSKVTNLTIPSEITTINNMAFYGCGSLMSVTIPSHVTNISWSAFCGCQNIAQLTIEEGVTTIESYAFANCSKLKSVTIPDSVWRLGEAVFSRCNSLTEINCRYSTADKRCLLWNSTLNSFAPADLTSYDIPDSVTAIGSDAFYGYSNLTSISIPEGVTSIGNSAFFNCDALTNVTLPQSVTYIYMAAFNSCNKLESVTIGANVGTIEDYAFNSCNKLTTVYCNATTPPTLGGTSVFDGNASGRKIYVPTAAVSAYKSAQYWSEYNIIGNGGNTGLYIHGASTDFESANVAEAMEYVEEDVFSITAFFAQSQNNEILISKEQSATYPYYALAANGEVVTITTPETTYTPLEIEANGLRKLTVNLNTLTWSWERITNQFAMPDSELPNYPTKAYIARDGSMKVWMTRHMAWDGGNIHPKLGSGMVKHTSNGTAGTGGYVAAEFPRTWNDAERMNPAYETLESGMGTLETYSDDGRIYTYHEMLGYEARFGIGYARYENGPWKLGEKYTDARGTTYTFEVVSKTAADYTGDNAADEEKYPIFKVQAQGICPFGWHVANASDWLDLFYAMGKASETGTHTYPVKTSDCTYKQMINGGVPNINGWLRNTKDWGTNYVDEGADEFGFNYYPLGYRYMTQGFQNWSMRAQVWVPLPMAGSKPDDYPSAGGGRINVVVKDNKTMTAALANLDIGQAVFPFRCVKNYK